MMAAVEQKSAHPLAAALVAHARNVGADMSLTADDFQDTAGEGVSAVVNGCKVQVGSRRLANKLGWLDANATLPQDFHKQIQELEESACTICYLGLDGRFVAVLGVADAPREEAREAVGKLQALGVETVILTGDQQRSADAVGKNMGITNVRAALLPKDKVDAVQQLKAKGQVGMVGDGINDAAALAASDVGIAMGAAGTQVALENAHVALMDSDLRKLVISIRLGRYAVRKIKQNVAFAVFSKLVMVVITMIGYASLWGAIIADLGAMLLVTLNASMVLNQRKDANKHGHESCCGMIKRILTGGHGHSHAHGGCCGHDGGNGGGDHGHSHGGKSCSGHGGESV